MKKLISSLIFGALMMYGQGSPLDEWNQGHVTLNGLTYNIGQIQYGDPPPLPTSPKPTQKQINAQYKSDWKELEPLYKVLKKYQIQLGMQKMNIGLHMVDIPELGVEDPTAVGSSDWDVKENVGFIYVVRRNQYNLLEKRFPKVPWPKNRVQDQRNTVLHEMLHCVIGKAEEEYAVRATADIIIKVK